MKYIVRTPHFRQSFRQRIQYNLQLRELFHQQLELFLVGDIEKTQPHVLKGNMLGLWSFSITKDIRVIYKEEEKFYVLVDVGTHEQVYGKERTS